MIGARFSARRSSPRLALLVLGSGVLLGALGMATATGPLVAISFAPLALGVSLLMVGERGFRARFAPAGLEIARPRQTIPYANLLEVRPLVPVGKPRPDGFPIQVVHTRGALVIPARLTLSSERVYAFLKGFLAGRRQALPEALEAYRVEQEGQFGPEKVWAYVGRRGRDLPAGRRLRAFAVGLLAAAALWAAIPLRRDGEPGWWFAAAVLAALGVGLLVQDATLRRRERRAGTALDTVALVIAPLGLAVQQPGMSGHLGWQEIRKVSVRTGRGTVTWSSAQAQPGVLLEVEGATIVLTDSYDRPLSEIHDRILRYWR